MDNKRNLKLKEYEKKDMTRWQKTDQIIRREEGVFQLELICKVLTHKKN